MSNYKISHVAWYLLLALLMIASPIVAQGDDEGPPGTRFVCIDGFGCAWTPLTDEDIEIVFPDTAWFEADFDAVPEGEWYFEYPPGIMMCAGHPIIYPESTGGAFFEPNEDGSEINVLGFAEDLTTAETVFVRMAPGAYRNGFIDVIDGSLISYDSFFGMSAEGEMQGYAMGEVESPDGTCTFTRSFTATKVG